MLGHVTSTNFDNVCQCFGGKCAAMHSMTGRVQMLAPSTAHTLIDLVIEVGSVPTCF